MKRFDWDVLHDDVEENDVLHSSEVVESIQIPAYANDQQRRLLFRELISAMDEVTFTAQRLRLDVGKDFVTMRRELGGGWRHREDDDEAFETPVPMSGVMNAFEGEPNE